MNKVREICIRKGIVQKELSSMVGVSQPTVSDWFNNKKDPSGSRLEKLAEILGVSRAVILGLDEVTVTETEIQPPPIDRRAEAKRLLESMSDEKYQAALQYLRYLDAQNMEK